jgi:predicted DNA-binding transcriptional regulator AlpA
MAIANDSGESPPTKSDKKQASKITKVSKPVLTGQCFYNTKQAASYLGLSTQYLEIARHKGGGPEYVKLSRAVRYKLSVLDEWMASHTRNHTGEA